MKHHTLSRVAERLYWLGRYIERAESTARLIMVNSNLLIDFPVSLPDGWRPLIDITGSDELFDTLFEEPSERNVVRFLAHDQRNPSSIVCSIDAARENARTVRDTMPRITYEIVNDLYRYAKSELGSASRARRVDALTGVTQRVQQLEGFLSANMIHDNKWSFLRIGSDVERADMMTRIVDVRSVDLLPDQELAPFQDIQWRSVLRSLYAMQGYQTAVQEPIVREPVLQFLFASPELPRAYRRCLEHIRACLRSLPRNDTPLRTCNRMLRQLRQFDFGALEGATLHEFVDQRQVDLADLHADITRTYFSFRPRIVKSRAARSRAT